MATATHVVALVKLSNLIGLLTLYVEVVILTFKQFYWFRKLMELGLKSQKVPVSYMKQTNKKNAFEQYVSITYTRRFDKSLHRLSNYKRRDSYHYLHRNIRWYFLYISIGYIDIRAWLHKNNMFCPCRLPVVFNRFGINANHRILDIEIFFVIPKTY